MRMILAVGLAVMALVGSAAAQTDDRPSFQPAPCDLPDITEALKPRLVCGAVAVPGGFRLAVVVIKPAGQSMAADPVVYIAGGPGSPLTSRAAFIATHEAAILAPGRNLILVDQRGVGRSEPALCPGLSRRQLAILASDLPQAALIGAWRDSYAACRREMNAAGVKPEWFGTQVNAADFEAVRKALGIVRWNVFSLSYGTSVAMTMMALFPDGLRAVVLDSVFPPDPLPITLPQSFGHARTVLFAACRANAACNTAHPALGTIFDDTLRALDSKPLAIAMPAAFDPQIFYLNGESFRLIVNRALYSRTTLATLPAFIQAAHDRQPQAMQGLIGRIAAGYLEMSVGDMAAVGCRDRPSWRALPAPDGVAAPPDSAFVPGMCTGWSPPGPPPLIAGSTVPSLILSGTIDPITPPEFARRAVAALGAHATMVEFAQVGHGAAEASACGIALVGAFIQDPLRKIDPACGREIPPIHFVEMPGAPASP